MTNKFCLDAIITQVLNKVKMSENENSALHCIQFLELPSKQLYPDYWQIIKQPISFTEIEGRIETQVWRLCNLALATIIGTLFYRVLSLFIRHSYVVGQSLTGHLIPIHNNRNMSRLKILLRISN